MLIISKSFNRKKKKNISKNNNNKEILEKITT